MPRFVIGSSSIMNCSKGAPTFVGAMSTPTTIVIAPNENSQPVVALAGYASRPAKNSNNAGFQRSYNSIL